MLLVNELNRKETIEIKPETTETVYVGKQHFKSGIGDTAYVKQLLLEFESHVENKLGSIPHILH